MYTLSHYGIVFSVCDGITAIFLIGLIFVYYAQLCVSRYACKKTHPVETWLTADVEELYVFSVNLAHSCVI